MPHTDDSATINYQQVLVRAGLVLLGLAGLLSAQTPKRPGYVGSDTCLACHSDLGKNFEHSTHHALETNQKKGWQGQSCEACHGPGAKHAESTSPSDIIRPNKLTGAKADNVCLTCHQNQHTSVGRIQSGHAHSAVSCVQCHSVHGTEPESLVKRSQPAINKLCSGCHMSEASQFRKPYTHRIQQNAMSCVDCHNPHGGVKPGNMQLVSANEPGCFRCHGDKRGPFPYEHAVVRIEGCNACHEPHGSANPRMLTRHQVWLVCVECHSNVASPGAAGSNVKFLGGPLPSFHNLKTAQYQNCTTCHTKVHGSYADATLLK
jgi:DmsE family decaheme c-type cytochrome